MVLGQLEMDIKKKKKTELQTVTKIYLKEMTYLNGRAQIVKL